MLMAVALTAAGAVNRPASAHDTGGLFQPAVSDLVIEGARSPEGRLVWLHVVDADSGKPAS